MLPKLGPRQDVDLFFGVYITVSFLAGYLLESSLDGNANGNTTKAGIVALWIGAALLTVGTLGFVGIPEGNFDLPQPIKAAIND